LGLLIARELARQGARVVITARDITGLERAHDTLARGGADVLAFPCDVARAPDVRALVTTAYDWFGSVDILIHCAGVFRAGPVEAMKLEDYERAMGTHFWGAVHLTNAVLPAMRAKGEGRVVHVTAIGGRIGLPHLVPYCASKFALTGFSEALRAEVAHDGVLVTTAYAGALGDAAPFTAMRRERAARAIVRACRRGDPVVTLARNARALLVAQAASPRFFTRVIGATARENELTNS
jgi:NAD(P)-dependent dehydrogenase (short-subunit alcohol dehydrogenase family)